ncbi:hypothetical protein CONLIGDRAFT_614585 [Coniochaeta ligniaria NRRL 30616]|uniref:Uncharacterized protein n=1 Tax=Coniochaeta ligniaria NRRL 30616 TaxID=1408157 RepID=A0A1J7ITU7_9PEZI|nr:hypothetical protein CONLIGDRAFT_614585 [Coniochaeta ligniaria NRRL 30616]
MLRKSLLLLVLCLAGLSLAQLYSFNQCEADVQHILDGTLTIGDISNETIAAYIYQGHVTGLKDDFPRSQYLALTYKGCTAICGNKVELNTAPTSLNIAATWVFPLAILLSLPYDSLHRKKYRKSLEAMSNWLGSPQTALTATIFNFRQISECQRRVSRRGSGTISSSTTCDVYFILSCMNQFELPSTPQLRRRFLEVLIYGLFRPLSAGGSADEEDDGGADAVLLRELAATMAFQLRMLRRRGVIPTLGSLATFLIAFVFSVVLAFDDLGDRTTAHSLGIGLLFGWLPLLIISSIIDRNPVSADRSARRELMSRWLYNVNAIMDWRASPDPNTDPSLIRWWKPSSAGQETLQLGHFVGQGRKMKYCGLVSAVIHGTEEHHFDSAAKSFAEGAGRVFDRLESPRPRSWHVIAVVSELLVVCEIMMGFTIAFATPTVGLGCRSLAYFLTALFSSVAWAVQFHWKKTPTWAVVVSHCFNGTTIFLSVAIIGFQLTGGMNNCFCKSSLFNLPFKGGYMDFENAQFYKTNFDVVMYWAIATAIGGIVPVAVFFIAIFWWMRCKNLWRAEEREVPRVWDGPQADMNWLR